MTKSRLEAFSDGVFAIIITIMVLEMKTPGVNAPLGLAALLPLLPTFLSYVLSYIFVGIYWVNHHHLMAASTRVTGLSLWANLHLLFWLSLFPFTTSWVGQTHFAPVPVGVYGLVLLFAAAAWDMLRRVLIRHHGAESLLGVSVGRGVKEWISTILFAGGVGAAFAFPRRAGDTTGMFDHATWGSLIAFITYCVVSAIWVVPDRRIERRMAAGE